MEVSATYGIINLVIVSFFYVGIAFSIAWTMKKQTRIFGLVAAIMVLLLTQAHANTLYYLAFGSLALGYNIIGLILALTLAGGLLFMQYRQLKAAGVPIVGRQFGKNLAKGLFLTLLLTIVLSLMDRIL